MELSLMTDSGDVFGVTVAADATLGAIVDVIRRQRKERDEFALFLDGRKLTNDGMLLRDLGVRDGDMLYLRHVSDADVTSVVTRDDSNPAFRRLSFLPFNHPVFFDAPGGQGSHAAGISNWPSIEDNQRGIQENMQLALEFAPELYTPTLDWQGCVPAVVPLTRLPRRKPKQIPLLVIDVVVNGVPLKAVVDSGAQITIMSLQCVKRCRLAHMVDKRWIGMAQGIGSSRVLGRIHLCDIRIGVDVVQTSISILEDQPIDMLLGLDTLRRLRCRIDLNDNRFHIGATGHFVHFLGERDFPDFLRS